MTKKLKKTQTLIFNLAALLLATTAQAHHYKVDGIYKMDVQIGERHFVDLVTLKEEADHRLSGTVTVPGNFTAALSGEYGQISFSNQELISFSIEAIEGGEKIRVLYSGIIDERSSADGLFFRGELYNLDNFEAGPFGTMTAVPLKAVPLPSSAFPNFF